MIVTIGLIQMTCGSDPPANLQKAMERIRQAAARGAQIICLPELFKSLYFCQTEEHDQFRPGRESARSDHRASGLTGP